MKRFPIKSGVILLAIVIGSVFLNKYITKDRLIFYPKTFITLGGYLFKKVENFGGLVGKVKNFNRLASENDELKQNQKIILELKVKIDNLENENYFLKRAARISQKLNYPIVYAGVFNLSFAPTGYNALLNKGTRDGISEDDVVITAEGVLVGKIQKVMRDFSRVLFISDPEFKITAKVISPERSRESLQRATTSLGISSGITGIARGALSEGMYLDFIVQEDEIKEEDVLISTGNDLFPPALIIGFVDYVEVNATQMFKKVRIHPTVKDVKLGRVLVIKMK